MHRAAVKKKSCNGPKKFLQAKNPPPPPPPITFLMVRPLIKRTVSCDQQSEYDFTSEEEDHLLVEDQEEESGVEHYEMPVTPVNFNTL